MGENQEHQIFTNTDNNRLQDAFREHGCKDHIYMPAFQNNTLMYIPMPLKFAVYLFAGDAQRDIAREDLSCIGKRVLMAIQTKIQAVEGTRSVFCMLTHTFVDLS